MALYTPSNLPLTHLRCSRALLVAVLTLGSASISRAEAQVVRTPQGVVEFIGLRSWTVDMIRDSMRVHAPGEPLCQCAGVLRGLGFPAAAATGVGGDTTVVLLVEPAFADRIQRRVVPADSTSPDRWPVAQRLLAVGRGHPWQSAVQLGDWWTGGDSVRGPLVRQIVRDTVTFAQAAEFLASPDRLREVTVALQVLEHDGNATNRMIAAAILSRFPADPAAWTAVLAALTDRDDWVSGAAEHGLTFMMRQPSAGHGYNAPWPLLRTLVAGIRPGAVPDVLTVITNFATPEDARRAVAQNGHLVLALLESTRADWRTVAHRFLVAANDGRDLGPRASAWGAWIDGLAITPAGDAPSP